MSQSKGPRRAVLLRLKESTLLRLQTIKADSPTADGLPDVVDELVALHGDRDATLAQAIREAAESRADLLVRDRVIADLTRRLKAEAKARRSLEARLGRRREAPQAPLPLTPSQAFQRDHAAGLHAVGASVGPLPGACPACPAEDNRPDILH